MSLFYRFTRVVVKSYFQLFYQYKVYGIENALNGKAILAANHTSFLDPPLIAASWPEELHFLARASLFHSTLGGWVLPHLNSHPVKGTAEDIESFRLICSLLSDGKKVAVFPEGERSSTGELQAMKPGIAMLALRMECPIIPVYVGGTFEAWSRHSRWPKLGISIVCIFGAPIYPSFPLNVNKKQKQEMMTRQVQDSLEKLSLSWKNTKKI